MSLSAEAPPRLSLLTIVATICAGACSTVRPVEPLAPGQFALAGSVGGPLINTLGTVFPTPMLTAGGSYGLGERWVATGSVGLTEALFGVVHVEPGATFFPWLSQEGEMIFGATASLHVLVNGSDALVAPQLSGTASWRLSPAWLVYGGGDLALVLRAPARPIWGPLGGVQWRTGRTSLSLETKWLAPHHDVEPAAPGWISPAHQGYLTVLLGARFAFGGHR